MVSYPLFLEYVKDNIISFMPEEYSNYCVEEVQALKENGQVFTGISIVKNENGCNPAFYCEGFYKMYQDTQDIDEVMRFIAEQYVKWDKVGAQMALPDPENFEEVKDLIGYSVVNEQLNRDMLKELVHTTVEDLAKVYRVFYMDDEGCKSLKITNELMKGWGISIEELDSIANENMPVLFPPAAAEVSKNNSLTLLERIHNNPEINLAPGGSIYMLTNKYMRGGASVIFYPDLLKTVHAQIQEDFYILPASIHEVYILTKEDQSPKHLGEMVRTGNKEFVSPNDVLSDCVYEYIRDSDCIRKVPESVLQVEKNRGMER